MRFSLATVFYKPTEIDILSFIELSLNFKNSFVYLNSSLSRNQINLLEKKKIDILGQQKNDGLSIAYNQILLKALEKNQEFVLLTDQDSRFEKFILNEFIKDVSLKEKQKPGVAIFSMLPKNNEANIISEFDLKKSKKKFVSKRFSINSGSLLRVSAWSQVGGYDEKLFIDKIDTDFCIALKSNRWDILQSRVHTFRHSVGKPKRFLFGLISYNSQNAFRHYHSMYSRIHIFKKSIKNLSRYNPIFFLKIIKFILQVLKCTSLTIIFEEKKIIKLIKSFKPLLNKKY